MNLLQLEINSNEKCNSQLWSRQGVKGTLERAVWSVHFVNKIPRTTDSRAKHIGQNMPTSHNFVLAGIVMENLMYSNLMQ